jgi:hypothetical protein
MNETNETTMQAIYYWQDGYWITDQEEAELLDSINAFGSEHCLLEVPEGEDIQQAVNAELISLAE